MIHSAEGYSEADPLTTLAPGITQFVERPGIVDLGPGYLQPSLLPVAVLSRALSDAFAARGASALSYGANRGPAPLRSLLAAKSAQATGLTLAEEHVLVTAGASQLLHYVSAACASSTGSVLVEEPTYDLACRIFESCRLDVVSVASDELGMAPDALHGAIRAQAAAARPAGFLYLIPTFHNPTGRVMPRERRERLLDVARSDGLLIVEDNAYLELAYDDPPPPSLLTLAGNEGVIQAWSFSKTLGPGLRLGWIVTDAERVERMGDEGLFMSGGCVNQVLALGVGELYSCGAADRHIEGLRAKLHERRDALVEALRSAMPAAFPIDAPAGGYFVWIPLPPGLSQRELLAEAEAEGISFALGSRFRTAAGQEAIRLSFSFHPAGTLRRAAEVLGRVCARAVR